MAYYFPERRDYSASLPEAYVDADYLDFKTVNPFEVTASILGGTPHVLTIFGLDGDPRKVDTERLHTLLDMLNGHSQEVTVAWVGGGSDDPSTIKAVVRRREDVHEL